MFRKKIWTWTFNLQITNHKPDNLPLRHCVLNNFSGMENFNIIYIYMDGRQIVLVLTAEFSVLNTEIFQQEALSRFTVFTQLQSRMSSCLSSTLSLSKILFLPTYVIYLFTLIYLNVVWSLKNLFFTTDIITIYYFNSILYYMLYDNIILKLIRKYNILWIRKINVFPTVFLSL